jgi:predicted nucleotidyltransferase
MEQRCRTFETELREARRLHLRDKAETAAAFVAERGGFEVWVSGSLSRGQVHPWSDLDLVLSESGPSAEDRSGLRYDLLRHLDMDGVDVVFEDEIFPGLAKGMLGSLVRADEVPPLSELPDPRVALARVHVSIGYALKSSEQILVEYAASEQKLRGVIDDYDSMVFSHAMDPLSRKAPLWVQKLAVFMDAGRAEWLDDRFDEEALDRLLARLSTPQSGSFGRDTVIDAEAAGALRYLVIDAYDFVVRRRRADSPRDEYGSVVEAIRSLSKKLEAMVPGVETHGLTGGS